MFNISLSSEDKNQLDIQNIIDTAIKNFSDSFSKDDISKKVSELLKENHIEIPESAVKTAISAALKGKVVTGLLAHNNDGTYSTRNKAYKQ